MYSRQRDTQLVSRQGYENFSGGKFFSTLRATLTTAIRGGVSSPPTDSGTRQTSQPHRGYHYTTPERFAVLCNPTSLPRDLGTQNQDRDVRRRTAFLHRNSQSATRRATRDSLTDPIFCEIRHNCIPMRQSPPFVYRNNCINRLKSDALRATLGSRRRTNTSYSTIYAPNRSAPPKGSLTHCSDRLRSIYAGCVSCNLFQLSRHGVPRPRSAGTTSTGAVCANLVPDPGAPERKKSAAEGTCLPCALTYTVQQLP